MQPFNYDHLIQQKREQLLHEAEVERLLTSSCRDSSVGRQNFFSHLFHLLGRKQTPDLSPPSQVPVAELRPVLLTTLSEMHRINPEIDEHFIRRFVETFERELAQRSCV